MTSTERTAFLLALTAIVMRLGFMLSTQFIADDAFITYRYAENLGTGIGFVYNAGESVLGTTTPLFTIFLSIAKAVGLSIPITSFCIALVASGLTAAVLYRYALQLRLAEWAIVPATLYCIWPRSILADSSGMETALFTLFLVLSAYWFARNRMVYASGCAALAALTRPEGGFLLGILLLSLIIRGHEEKWKAALVAAIPLFLWVTFATITFGSPFPNSVAGKLSLYVGELETPIRDRIGQLIGSTHPIAMLGAIMLIAVAFIGYRWLWRTQRKGEIESVWLIAVVALYLFFTPRIFFWYLAPLYPWLFLLLVAGGMSLLRRLSISRTALYARPAFVVIACVLLSLPMLYKSWNYWREHQIVFEHVHRAIGEYLSVQVGKDEIVAAEDIGYMGYLSKARILDRDGLVSPVARRYNESGDHGRLLFDLRPQWAVIADGYERNAFTSDSTFRVMYHEVEHFAYEQVSYRVYRLTSP